MIIYHRRGHTGIFCQTEQREFYRADYCGQFVSIAAWASFQRTDRRVPYWWTLKVGGNLNAKFPGGIEAQKELFVL